MKYTYSILYLLFLSTAFTFLNCKKKRITSTQTTNNGTTPVKKKSKCLIDFEKKYAGVKVSVEGIITEWKNASGKIELPECITGLTDTLFKKNTNITEVDLSKTKIKTIPNFCFREATKLTSIQLPNNLTTIERSAFYGTSALKKIILPPSLTTIARYAFYASRIDSIDLSNTKVTKITPSCFSYASNLKIAKLPNTITTIEQSAFYGARSLQSITLSTSLTTIGHYAFSETKALKNITFPNSLTTLESSAFDMCCLTNADLTKTKLTEISISCFANSKNLKKVKLPKTITSIQESAFWQGGLDTLELESTNPPTILCYKNGKHNSIPNSIKCIIVPTSSVETYKKEAKWQQFSSKINKTATK